MKKSTKNFDWGRNMKKLISTLGLAVVALLFGAESAFAEGATGASDMLPISVAFAMGIAVIGGTFAQGRALSSALESIGRNPSSRGDIFVPMLIGLAFIESLVILGFVISNQLVGKF